jgi:hypothetical protein
MKLSLAVALSGLLMAGAAHADLVIDAGKKPIAQPVVRADGNLTPGASQAPRELPAERVVGKVTQVGSPNAAEQGAVVQGWADRVALSDALRQILPSGFSVIPDDQFRMDRQVSWEGGQSWIAVLDHMTRLYSFNVTVDWARHQIRLSPLTPPQASALAAAQHTTGLAPIQAAPPVTARPSSCITGCSQSVTVRTGSSASSAPVQAAPVAQAWILDPARSLKENVEAWGKQAGWVVKWDAVDYRVPAKVALRGSFDAPDGPVATLVKAYEKADQPITAHLTTMDHVLSVTNKNYQPSSVVPLSGDADVSRMLDSSRSPSGPDKSTEDRADDRAEEARNSR